MNGLFMKARASLRGSQFPSSVKWFTNRIEARRASSAVEDVSVLANKSQPGSMLRCDWLLA
jgi:hypothetical protein